jgi:hypothetical protein
MHALKVQVKIFAAGAPDVMGYVPIFHRWIRDSVLKELIIDVVDYSHVANGPEVLMVGDAADYALDRGAGRIGLLYVGKRESETAEGPFALGLKKALNACRLLEAETGPTVPLAFSSSELEIRVADRLRAPNDDATFERLLPSLRAPLEKLYAGTQFELRRVGTPRDLFSVEVRAAGAPSIAELAQRAQS